MTKMIPTLSKGMLITGMLMILAGLGWGIWMRVNAPPPPTITEAGAVVLAVTAPSLAASATPQASASPATSTPQPTLQPPRVATQLPPTQGPTPEILPNWVMPTETPAEMPTAFLPTPWLPTPTPIPVLTPAPTPELLPDWALPTETPAEMPTALLPTPWQPTPTPIPVLTPAPPAEAPPVRIVAPAIKLDAKVVPMTWDLVDQNGTMVSQWVVPKNAAGWHVSSALPGHGGNVVISGHHNIDGKVFRYVVDLEPGDEIALYVGDTPYYYTVTEKYILKEAGMPLQVRQKNAQWIMPTDEERLTLVTCWPYEWPGNTHRVIVVARPKDYTTALDTVR